jgi:hypothetical protein
MMGLWKKFESTVVRLTRSYENTVSVVCLTMKGTGETSGNFEELKPAGGRIQRTPTCRKSLTNFIT